MKTEENRKNGLVILNYVLIVVSFIGLIYGMVTFDSLVYRLTASLNIVGLVVSFLYLLNGYKKDVAKYYQWYMIIHASGILLERLLTYLMENPLVSPLECVLSSILFGNVLLLAFGKDIGKKGSYIICSVCIAIYCLLLGTLLANMSYITNPTERVATLIIYVVWLLTCCIQTVMVVGKFKDKQQRKGVEANK